MSKIDTSWRVAQRASIPGKSLALPSWLVGLKNQAAARNFTVTAGILSQTAHLLRAHRNIIPLLSGEKMFEAGLMSRLGNLDKGLVFSALMALATAPTLSEPAEINLEEAAALQKVGRLDVARLVEQKDLRKLVLALKREMGVAISGPRSVNPLHEQSPREMDVTIAESAPLAKGRLLSALITEWARELAPTPGNYTLQEIIELTA